MDMLVGLLDLRPVDVDVFDSRTPGPLRRHAWFRASGTLPDDPALHRLVLTYSSDMTLIDVVLQPHGVSFADQQIISLDHAVWFHRDFRADEWLLYEH